MSWSSLSHRIYFTNAVLLIEDTESGPPWSLPAQNSCKTRMDPNKPVKGIILPPSQYHHFWLKEAESRYGAHYWTGSTLRIRILQIMWDHVARTVQSFQMTPQKNRPSHCDSVALFICWSPFSIQSFSFHKPSARLTRCLSPDGLARRSLTFVPPHFHDKPWIL